MSWHNITSHRQPTWLRNLQTRIQPGSGPRQVVNHIAAALRAPFQSLATVAAKLRFHRPNPLAKQITADSADSAETRTPSAKRRNKQKLLTNQPLPDAVTIAVNPVSPADKSAESAQTNRRHSADTVGTRSPVLKPEQRKFLELVEGGTNVTMAAACVRVHRDTPYKWAKRDPAFHEAWMAARRRHEIVIDDILHEVEADARAFIHQTLMNDRVAPGLRLRAAIAISQKRAGAWIPRPHRTDYPILPPDSDPDPEPDHDPTSDHGPSEEPNPTNEPGTDPSANLPDTSQPKAAPAKPVQPGTPQPTPPEPAPIRHPASAPTRAPRQSAALRDLPLTANKNVRPTKGTATRTTSASRDTANLKRVEQATPKRAKRPQTKTAASAPITTSAPGPASATNTISEPSTTVPRNSHEAPPAPKPNASKPKAKQPREARPPQPPIHGHTPGPQDLRETSPNPSKPQTQNPNPFPNPVGRPIEQQPKRLDTLFLSRYQIHRHESVADFQRLFREVVIAHEPHGNAEELTVLRIAQTLWQLRRIDTMEMAVADSTIDQFHHAVPNAHPAAALAAVFLTKSATLQSRFFDRMRPYRRMHEETLDRLENRLTRQQHSRKSLALRKQKMKAELAERNPFAYAPSDSHAEPETNDRITLASYQHKQILREQLITAPLNRD